MNVLISLQRWTPFMWEQDRFGMLLPLLAIPIRHPMANMLFQAFLATFAGISTFYLLARFAFRDARFPLVGTIGAVAFLTLTPSYYRFEYLVDTNYGLSLALALWALILVEPNSSGPRRVKWMVALVLMSLAHWVNSVTAFFLGPVLILRKIQSVGSPARWFKEIFYQPGLVFSDQLKAIWHQLQRHELFRALFVLAIGYEFGQFVISVLIDDPFNRTNYETLEADKWLHSWLRLLETSRQAMGRPLWLGSMGLELTVGLFALARSGRWRTDQVLRPALALIITAVGLWLLLGTRLWIQLNDYAFRYLFVSAIFIQTAVAGIAVSGISYLIPMTRRSRVVLTTITMLTLLGASASSYGAPSCASVRRDLDRRFGAMTDDLLASRSTCVAGDYWKVWVAVFHANLVLHERGDPRPFWGLSFRSKPTFELWHHTPVDKVAIGVANDDVLGVNWIRAYPVAKFELSEIRPTIHVYRPIPGTWSIP